MSDARPLYSKMPERLAAVYDRHRVAALAIMGVFQEALEAGDAAPAAELENDAFSLANQVASVGLSALAVEMARRKQVSIEFAMHVLLCDLADRVRLNLELLSAAEQAKGAVRQ